FDTLAVPDAQRDLLVWMHDPNAFRAGRSASEWTAFRNLVKDGYRLDLEDDGPNEAARRFLEGEGPWGQLWQRFCEAPSRYRGISKLLREPLPGQGFLIPEAKLPGINEERENRLRAELVMLTTAPHREACEKILALEAEHGERRQWIWSELGE